MLKKEVRRKKEEKRDQLKAVKNRGCDLMVSRDVASKMIDREGRRERERERTMSLS